MAKNKTPKEPQRKRVEVEIDCDTNRLYGDLKEAAAYLLEIAEQYPQASLDEHWTGYEDMEMRFVYHREENDEEFAARLEEERQEADRLERQRAEGAKKAERRQQWEKLNREFGR